MTLLRESGLEPIVLETNAIANRLHAESLTALKLFTLPAPLVQSKDDYWKMTKAERVRWQKEKEAERRKLNAAAGIDGKALLTVENVTQWRSEGMTYAAIARDIIGCPDWQVAEILKEGSKRKPYWNKK